MSEERYRSYALRFEVDDSEVNPIPKILTQFITVYLPTTPSGARRIKTCPIVCALAHLPACLHHASLVAPPHFNVT